MIIVDVETTGVDATKHSILSIGAIDFNDPSNRFAMECSAYPQAPSEQEALEITGHTKESIFDPSKPSEADAITAFAEWTKNVSDHTVAGQNCYFDLEFLRAAAHRIHLDLSLPKRIVDLHSVVWAHMIKRGIAIPINTEDKRSDINSDYIAAYVGIPKEDGPHIGINGALWETEAFSRLLYDKLLLPEYSSFKIPWL
jgi:DNA polymerase III epsilon subunit-like protein